MTNTRIKKIFKISFVIPLWILLGFIVSTLRQSQGDMEDSISMFMYAIFIPFIIMACLRIYNFLAYGKWVVEE